MEPERASKPDSTGPSLDDQTRRRERSCAWDGSVWRSRRWPCSPRRAAGWGTTTRVLGGHGGDRRDRHRAPDRRGPADPADGLRGRVRARTSTPSAAPPFWSLFGDGTLIVPVPQIEIYPGPALPNLTATPVSEDGIQAILEAAARRRPAGRRRELRQPVHRRRREHRLHDHRRRHDVGRLRVRARRGRPRRHLWERQGRRRPREARGLPGQARPTCGAGCRTVRSAPNGPTTRPRCACTSSPTREIPNCRRTRSSGRSSPRWTRSASPSRTHRRTPAAAWSRARTSRRCSRQLAMRTP